MLLKQVNFGVLSDRTIGSLWWTMWELITKKLAFRLAKKLKASFDTSERFY